MEAPNKPPNAKAAKDDKKARRAAKVALRPAGAPDGPTAQGSNQQTSQQQQQPPRGSQPPQQSQQQQSKGRKQGTDAGTKPAKKLIEQSEKPVERTSHWFEFFEDRPSMSLHDQKVAGVHPSMLALGLQIRNLEICGSQARCVAMMLAFKAVIRSYKTPEGTSLARHLASHGLSPQITYLKACRSLSVTQANAIRDLKNKIAAIDPSVAEDAAKQRLCDEIDTFIRERFTVADQVIADTCGNLIQDGDTIMTFAHSAVVKQALLQAAASGRKFSVIVVDSRPLNEGKNLARALSSSFLDQSVAYCHYSSVCRVITRATKVILGAHALYANGGALSRLGAAGICAEAKHNRKPVVFLAESIKITDRIALDSLAVNELLDDPAPAGKVEKLNPLFDLTPAEHIDQVITEIGVSTPGNVSAFLRIKDV